MRVLRTHRHLSAWMLIACGVWLVGLGLYFTILRPPLLPEDLRFTRSGQHFIVFIEDAAQVIIVDFLHSRSDLPGKIAALSSAKTQNNH